MPFFSRSEPAQQPVQPAPQPVYEEQPKKHGLFSRHRSPSPARTTSTSTRHTNSTYQTSPERGTRSSSGSRGGLLRRSFGNGSANEMDPSIVAARERVMSAEMAEREADRALMAARDSVREAREHVRRLELEAQEEARRAKIKQQQAKEVSKRGKQLGRRYSIDCHLGRITANKRQAMIRVSAERTFFTFPLLRRERTWSLEGTCISISLVLLDVAYIFQALFSFGE